MLYIVIAYLWGALCLYLLFGGADFGAGIVELLAPRSRKRQVRRVLYEAIGPVWEANHMWLIIAVVILFVGFPEIYTVMSVYIHIPLLLMLLGIMARGTAFVFRNYDAVTDGWQRVYSRIFVYASTVTPFFLGVVAASTVSRSIDTSATAFTDAYITSWLNGFGVAVGLFTVMICGYLAAVYAVGAAPRGPDRQLFARMSLNMMAAVVCAGSLVFGAAAWDDVPLLRWIFEGWIGRLAIIAASISVVVMIYMLKNEVAGGRESYRGYTRRLRALAGFQVAMILLAATYDHFPDIVLLKSGGALSLTGHAGSEGTINSLAWALLLGSMFILPALYYLIFSFAGSGGRNPERHTAYE